LKVAIEAAAHARPGFMDHDTTPAARQRDGRCQSGGPGADDFDAGVRVRHQHPPVESRSGFSGRVRQRIPHGHGRRWSATLEPEAA
jgi:hypothetical protein